MSNPTIDEIMEALLTCGSNKVCEWCPMIRHEQYIEEAECCDSLMMAAAKVIKDLMENSPAGCNQTGEDEKKDTRLSYRGRA